MKYVDITSRFGDVALRITLVTHPFDSEATQPALEARLTAQGLQSSGLYVQDGESPQTITEFFNDIHAEHSGWDGDKSWASAGGELKIRADHDWVNAVRLYVTMTGGATPRWTSHAELHVDPGRFHRVGANLELYASELLSGDDDPDAVAGRNSPHVGARDTVRPVEPS